MKTGDLIWILLEFLSWFYLRFEQITSFSNLS